MPNYTTILTILYIYSYNTHDIGIITSFKDRRQDVTPLIISCLNYLCCIIQKKKGANYINRTVRS